jgi:membrane protease YdiL (CAAX protease family)
MKLWRTPLGRALLLGVALGVAGGLIGLAVGASRDADLATSTAWGLYIAGAVLLFFGASPTLAPPPPPAVLATMPGGASEQLRQRQRDRIVNAPWMLLNFFVAIALIGIGALFEIYG